VGQCRITNNTVNCSTPYATKGIGCQICEVEDPTNCTDGLCNGRGGCVPPVETPDIILDTNTLFPPYTTTDSQPWCLQQVPALCPSDTYYPTHEERLAWVLYNSIRLDIDGFSSHYGIKDACSESRRAPTYPLYWDTKLQQGARFQSYSMGTSADCLQENTCSTSCPLFSQGNATDCTDDTRVNIFLNKTADGGRLALGWVRVDTGNWNAFDQMTDWVQGHCRGDDKSGYSWICDGLMDTWLDSAAMGYFRLESSRYVDYWTLNTAYRRDWWFRRPWPTPFRGGGSHFLYGDKVRFVVNYFSQHIPQYVEVVYEGQPITMKLQSGKPQTGLIFGSSAATFYVDLPIPSGEEYCRAYYFQTKNDDATFRFPETGHFLTFNITGCLEDYSPSNSDGEFVGVPGAPYFVNYTYYGWDDSLGQFDFNAFRWRFNNQWKDKYGYDIRFWPLYENHTDDNTTGVSTFFLTDTKEWPIPSYLVVELLETNKIQQLGYYDYGRGGVRANYTVVGSAYTGTLDPSASHVETTANQITAGVLLSVGVILLGVLVFFAHGVVLTKFTLRTKQWSWPVHCYFAAGVCFSLWILSCVAQSSEYWAATDVPTAVHLGLWNLCYAGQSCVDTAGVTEGGKASIQAAQAFMILGQFGGVVSWICALILGMGFMFDRKMILSHSIAIGMLWMAFCTTVSVVLFLAYFDDVLVNQPFASFYPHWGWALATVVAILSYVAVLYIYPLTTKEVTYGMSDDPSQAPGARKVGAWERIWDEDNKDFYYYNNKTNESKWDKPAGF